MGLTGRSGFSRFVGDRQPRTTPTKDLPHRVVFRGGVVCELSEPKRKKHKILGGTKRDKLNGTKGFLQKSAVSCGFLRKSAVSCENLRPRNAVITKKSENLRKSAKNCESRAFVPFSLSLLFPPEKYWADPGVLWKKAPRAMRAMRGKALETVPFQPYFGCRKSFSSKYCQTRTAKQREL